MSKTLSHILTVFKVVKIIAKVIFILCIIGAAFCTLGLIVLPLAGLASEFLPEETLAELGLTISASYVGVFTALIVCIGEAVFAFFAERYFGHVLASGTPFTLGGSKECLRLGLMSIILSVATSVAAGIASFVLLLLDPYSVGEFDITMSVSLSTGLFFLFLSLIFKHGAELQIPAPAAEPVKVEEPASSEAPSTEEDTAKDENAQ